MPRGFTLRGMIRFWERVDRSGGPDACWPWIPKSGRYGKFNIAGTAYVSAHRFAYELEKGPIPAGYFVLHACDNTRCVNPAHLRVGTAKENSEDMVKKGRQSRGDAHWVRKNPEKFRANHPRSKLTPEQVSEIRTSKETQRALAAKFGVCQATIGHILTGRNRKV